MRRSSLLFTSKSSAAFSGNEPVFNKVSIRYGSNVYTWNQRYVSLINAFFTGNAVHNVTGLSYEVLEKFVAYANGTLAITDKDYDTVDQYNSYLATL